MKQIIGLTGLAIAGKDTAAGYVLEWAETQGLRGFRSGFADALKESAALALGAPSGRSIAEYISFCNNIKDRGEFTLKVPYTEAEIEAGVDAPEEVTFSGRKFLQWYGTEAHRDVFDTDFWVNAFFDRAEGWSNEFDFLVIPDTRFDNEAAAIKRRGGIILDVHRPSLEAPDEHVSESGLPDEYLTCSIRNEGDLSDLRKAVFNTCDSLLGE